MDNDTNFIEIPEGGKLEVSPGAYLAMTREDARKKISIYYVIGFILTILYAMTLFWITKMSVSDLKDLLVTISGVLSGPLGFIIGYYFKSQTDKE